jgi:hypothetical protein
MAERMPNRSASPVFDRQIAELRRVAANIRAEDPEGAAACLFAASVLSYLPADYGVPGSSYGAGFGTSNDGSGSGGAAH